MANQTTCDDGHPNPQGDPFCAQCGAALGPDAPPATIPQRSRRRAALLVAVVAVGVLAAGAAVWTSSGDEGTDNGAGTFSELPIDKQVMIQIRSANPNAMREHTEAEWLTIIDDACNLLAAGNDVSEIMANLQAAGASVDLRAGLRAGLDTKCPQYVAS